MNPADLIPLAVPVTYLIMFTTESHFVGRQFTAVNNWRKIGVGFFILLLVISLILPLIIPSAQYERNSPFVALNNWFAGTLFALLLTTFVTYWFHRAEHHFNWLWRIFHQIHHSAERVDIAGAFYTHPLEPAAKMTIGAYIAGHVLGLDAVASATVSTMSGLLSMFQHWNITTPYWLGYIVQRPESHCYHHEYNIHSRNYADLPIWDMIFGTYLNPRETAQLRVGFGGDSMPQLINMLSMQLVDDRSFPHNNR